MQRLSVTLCADYKSQSTISATFLRSESHNRAVGHVLRGDLDYLKILQLVANAGSSDRLQIETDIQNSDLAEEERDFARLLVSMSLLDEEAINTSALRLKQSSDPLVKAILSNIADIVKSGKEARSLLDGNSSKSL